MGGVSVTYQVAVGRITDIILAGNFRVNSKEDIPEALEALKDRPLYAEKWAYFKMVRDTPMHGNSPSSK
jgi:hypothetical protein